MRLSVIGLGKLGAPIAAAFASRGFPTIGVDVNPQVVEAINAGRSPVLEPGVNEAIAHADGRLRATQDYQDAIQHSDITFILVPTPSEPDGRFSLRYVRQAAEAVGQVLRQKREYHLVVVSSTVLPGSTEFGILPVLEGASGKRCGQDFGLCYSPEFVALGTVLRDFLRPDFVLIGESDTKAGDTLESLYRQVLLNQPPIVRTNWINAELAKIAFNTFGTLKISFCNMLAALCERLPGADVDTVTRTISLDRRISGPSYMKGALGYGGPCLPRDNRALAFLASYVGVNASLAETTDAFNRTVAERVVQRVLALTPPGGTVAVLGLAYKPDTPIVEESQGLNIAQHLAQAGVRVVVYDPLAMEEARKLLGEQVVYAPSVAEAVRHAHVVLIANPDPAFRALPLENNSPHPIVVDAWRLMRERFSNPSATYAPLGIGNAEPLAREHLARLWKSPAEQ
ncbi:MAG: nucleotide sugar dehydrogenase [Dehalococcoidia bacterium]|nr:nucleotide sugar dehydrogenase [Dehalococcoidia bacterium]MDW8119894.1 nucleotide sugar dehydrogenase [Chloroflexota bacterium]